MQTRIVEDIKDLLNCMESVIGKLVTYYPEGNSHYASISASIDELKEVLAGKESDKLDYSDFNMIFKRCTQEIRPEVERLLADVEYLRREGRNLHYPDIDKTVSDTVKKIQSRGSVISCFKFVDDKGTLDAIGYGEVISYLNKEVIDNALQARTNIAIGQSRPNPRYR